MLSRAAVISASLCVLFASAGYAHPGHGRDGGDESLAHYFTEPQHVVTLVVAGGLTLAVLAAAMRFGAPAWQWARQVVRLR